jgi:hypothetical protein
MIDDGIEWVLSTLATLAVSDALELPHEVFYLGMYLPVTIAKVYEVQETEIGTYSYKYLHTVHTAFYVVFTTNALHCARCRASHIFGKRLDKSIRKWDAGLFSLGPNSTTRER